MQMITARVVDAIRDSKWAQHIIALVGLYSDKDTCIQLVNACLV